MGWRDTNSYNRWGSEIAEIVSGGKTILETDTSWKSGLLPVLKSGIYFGEIYDAREEGLAATDGSAVVQDFNNKRLVPHETTAVQELAPFQTRKSVINVSIR